jgi:hypothetical protein
MSPAPKRSINLKEVLHDVRSKMADMDLMEKYELSPSQLQLVFKKLESAGYPISELHPTGAQPTPRASEPVPQSQGLPSPAPSVKPPIPGALGREPAPYREPDPARSHTPPARGSSGPVIFQCSHCFAKMQQRWDPCPRCGGQGTVVESHTLESQRYPQHPPQRTRPHPRAQTSTQSNPWVTIGLSVFVCTILAFGLIYFAAKRSTGAWASRPPSSTASIGGSAGIKAFTVENFAQDVVETSRKVPVLVEFYADW